MKKEEKKQDEKAKLKLHKETLRVLSSAELSRVHGGMGQGVSHNQAQSCGGGDDNDPETDPNCR